MKKIKYDDYIKEKKEKFFNLPAKLGRKRLARRKVRGPEERRALMLLNYQRYKKWVENGKLVEVGPRKYRFF